MSEGSAKVTGMDEAEKIGRLIDEARAAAHEDLKRLSGYDSLAGLEDECDRVHDEITAARLARAGGLPTRPIIEAPPWHAMTQNVPRGMVCRDAGAVDRPQTTFLRTTGTISGTFAPGPASKTIKVRHDDVSAPASTIEVVPDRRPDGFSQSAVDAAKAVLLAPVAKRGGR